MQRFLRRSTLPFAMALALGCGARSSLPGASHQDDTTSTGGGPPVPCIDGQTEPCGSDVGACKKGIAMCKDGVLGPCVGAIGPTPELCNGIDDNCDGQIDEGFHLGEPCDGPDSDLCLDDVMTCDGCSAGPDNVETCNGIDDNCNGIVDADCEVGDCKPTLDVIGSMPSNPACIDFPVMAGSTGTIEYPCGGGPVTATLGGIPFTGSVTNGFVTLDGIDKVIGPDTCTWQTSHHIEGNISSGVLNYSYSEKPVVDPPGVQCWTPCTEVGTVQINWVP